MIIRYLVEEAFKDKYTKKDIHVNTILEVDLERMKELNEKKKGRVIDIIIENNNTTISENKEIEENDDNVDTMSTDTEDDETSLVEGKEIYTAEQLQKMTVNELKDLAERLECELTKAKKEEIIAEILEFQAK